MDPNDELGELEKKLEDALARFDRTPGALWLAATAIVESASRLREDLPSGLAERRSELLVRARRTRDEAGPRSSENDVSAITLWVELAEKRAALERVVKAALAEVTAHRADHAWLGETPRSRKELEKALGEREKDVTERAARLAEPALDGESGPDDDETASDSVLARRSADARARLAKRGTGRSAALLGVVAALSFLVGATQLGDERVGAALALGAMITLFASVAGLVAVQRAGARDRIEAGAMRRRDRARAADAKEDHARLIAAARALGALDAFGASDDGRTLEDRESKLVTLAPWIRELVSGFSADEAARFL